MVLPLSSVLANPKIKDEETVQVYQPGGANLKNRFENSSRDSRFLRDGFRFYFNLEHITNYGKHQQVLVKSTAATVCLININTS